MSAIVQSASQTYTITIVGPLAITSLTLPNGVQGKPYSFQLTAIGGTPPYTWSETGALPTGLTLSPGGLISGTPTVTVTNTTLTVSVTDAGT